MTERESSVKSEERTLLVQLLTHSPFATLAQRAILVGRGAQVLKSKRGGCFGASGTRTTVIIRAAPLNRGGRGGGLQQHHRLHPALNDFINGGQVCEHFATLPKSFLHLLRTEASR